MPTRPTPTPAGSGTIDFAKCFRFAVEDPDWVKKILFGGLFTLLSALIVGIFFVSGYWVRFLRRERPLPLPRFRRKRGQRRGRVARWRCPHLRSLCSLSLSRRESVAAMAYQSWIIEE